MNKTTILSMLRLILISYLLLVSCSSDSFFGTNFPAGSNRGTGDVIDLQATSGALEFGEGNLPSVGSGEIELTDISIDDGSIIFPPPTASLDTQQVNFANLEASFEMWVAVAESIHSENPGLIAVGAPDFTWDITTEQVTGNIYDFWTG